MPGKPDSQLMMIHIGLGKVLWFDKVHAIDDVSSMSSCEFSTSRDMDFTVNQIFCGSTEFHELGVKFGHPRDLHKSVEKEIVGGGGGRFVRS